VFTLAAGSVVTELAKGKTRAESILIKQSAILDLLERMPEDHEHCALLAAMTFQKALMDSRKRRNKGNKNK
jgi:nitrogen fixation NifU-like protein